MLDDQNAEPEERLQPRPRLSPLARTATSDERTAKNPQRQQPDNKWEEDLTEALTIKLRILYGVA